MTTLPLPQINIREREGRTPEMLEVNPTGEIPSLVTDTGLALSESVAYAQPYRNPGLLSLSLP